MEVKNGSEVDQLEKSLRDLMEREKDWQLKASELERENHEL